MVIGKTFVRLAFVALAAACSLAACGEDERRELPGSSSEALNSSANLQLRERTNSCGTSQVQDFLQVTNGAATAVKISDITIKLWVDDTSGQNVVPEVSTGGCLTNANGCFHQVSGVRATATHFSPACGTDASHQADWEVTISNTDSAMLDPGVTWANLQSSIHLQNFAQFSPGTDNWYSSCVGGAGFASDSHFAVYVGGNLVTASPGVPPSCRAPHGQQQLSGEIPPSVSSAPLVSGLSGATRLDLAIGLPLRDPAGLESFVEQVSDPASPVYRQYLTPAQFGDRYGATPTDYQALVAFAQSSGLTVVSTYPSRTLLAVNGTVADIERAFFVTLNVYQRPDGTTFFAPANEPSLNLGTPLLHISGLDNMAVPHANAGTGPGWCFAPGANTYIGKDFRAAYVPCLASTVDGSGQGVALFENDSYSINDISSYSTLTGIALPPLTNIQVPPTASTFAPGSANGEVTLDIDMVLSMAPKAHLYVYEHNFASPFDPVLILTQMANDNLARVISSSWTWDYGATPYLDPNIPPIFQQYAAQGQSFFISAGDTGAYVAGAPRPMQNPLLDTPLMTVVGGTQLTTGSGATYLSETAWNDPNEGSKKAGGGGVCTGLAAPWYQLPFSAQIAAAGGNAAFRNIPDVSIVADNLFTYADNGSQLCSWGTSASAPLWAGFAALVDQQATTAGKGALGFANPTLYSLASASYSADFHDVPAGSNNNFSGSGLFQTFAGYDLATGLGSPKCSLATDLVRDQAIRVGVGVGSACAVTAAGGVKCWGSNAFGDLGNNSSRFVPSSAPVAALPSGQGASGVAVEGGGGARALLEAGSACAVTAGGGVLCWGDNTFGELGIGTDPAVLASLDSCTGSMDCSLTPRQVLAPTGLSNLSGATVVSVGGSFGGASACAIVAGGVVCWGSNNNGQLGNNSSVVTSPLPVPVNGLTTGVTSLSVGEGTACAVAGGSVSCWGAGGHGQLGNSGPLGTCVTGESCSLVPLPVTGLPANVTSVSVGNAFACAVTASGNVWCWGDNDAGELGNNSTTSSPVPVLVSLPSGVTAVSVSAGVDSACAVTAGGGVLCWGDNTFGELGNNSATSSRVPVPVTGLASGVTSVSVGLLSACAVTAGGSVVCWGDNSVGELGNNSIAPSSPCLDASGRDATTCGSLVPVPVVGFP